MFHALKMLGIVLSICLCACNLTLSLGNKAESIHDSTPNTLTCFNVDGDGYTECEGDCDDTDVTINPDATEVCDEIDNNCNGIVDENGVDNDNDGYNTCSDCDDHNSAINPTSFETCDGTDENCNGAIDEDPVDGDEVWCKIDEHLYLQLKIEGHINEVTYTLVCGGCWMTSDEIYLCSSDDRAEVLGGDDYYLLCADPSALYPE